MTRRFYHGNQPRDPTYSFDFRDHADDYDISNTAGGLTNSAISKCPFTDVSATVRNILDNTLNTAEEKNMDGVTLAISQTQKYDHIEISDNTSLWNTEQSVCWELLFQFNEDDGNKCIPLVVIRDPVDSSYAMWGLKQNSSFVYEKDAYQSLSTTIVTNGTELSDNVFSGSTAPSDLNYENNKWNHVVVTMDPTTTKMKWYIREPGSNSLRSDTYTYPSNQSLYGCDIINLNDFNVFSTIPGDTSVEDITIKYFNVWVGGSVLTDLEVENLYFSRFHGASWDTRYYSGPVISSDTTNIFGNYYDTSFGFVRPVATDLFYDTAVDTSYQLFSDISHLDISGTTYAGESRFTPGTLVEPSHSFEFRNNLGDLDISDSINENIAIIPSDENVISTIHGIQMDGTQSDLSFTMDQATSSFSIEMYFNTGSTTDSINTSDMSLVAIGSQDLITLNAAADSSAVSQSQIIYPSEDHFRLLEYVGQTVGTDFTFTASSPPTSLSLNLFSANVDEIRKANHLVIAGGPGSDWTSDYGYHVIKYDPEQVSTQVSTTNDVELYTALNKVFSFISESSQSYKPSTISVREYEGTDDNGADISYISVKFSNGTQNIRVKQDISIDYLVVAGGGGGGGGGRHHGSGGGGAGGVMVSTNPDHPVTLDLTAGTTYSMVVGNGGGGGNSLEGSVPDNTGHNSGNRGSSGSPSYIRDIAASSSTYMVYSWGGGGGGAHNGLNGLAGGSSGGPAGGNGLTSGNLSTWNGLEMGHAGANGTNEGGCGGGGAGDSPDQDGANKAFMRGGIGIYNNYETGSNQEYGGGGGGGWQDSTRYGNTSFGGGLGGMANSRSGGNATSGTGGGGGAGGVLRYDSGGIYMLTGDGGSGGRGVIVLRIRKEQLETLVNFTDVSFDELDSGSGNNSTIYADSTVYTAYISNAFKNANHSTKLLHAGRTTTYTPSEWSNINWGGDAFTVYHGVIQNRSHVMIGKEVMTTGSYSNSMVGVTRGQFGTTAMDISINTPIFVLNVDDGATYPIEERTINVNSQLATQSQTSNTWNHIVLSYDNDNQTINTYLNGTKESFTTQAINSSNTLKIGNGFMGKIAYLNVWDISLSDNDASELYQSRDVPNDSKYKYFCTQNIIDIIRKDVGPAKYLLNVNYNTHDIPFYNHEQQFNRKFQNTYLGPQVLDPSTDISLAYDDPTTLDVSYIRLGGQYDTSAVYVIDYTREIDGEYHITSKPTTDVTTFTTDGVSAPDTRHLSVFEENHSYGYTASHGGISHNPTRLVAHGPLLRLNNYIYVDFNRETNEFDLFMDASGTLQFHPRKIFFDQAYTFMSVDSPITPFKFYITDISTNPDTIPATFESQLGVLQSDAERDVSLGVVGTTPTNNYHTTGINGQQSVTFRYMNDVTSTDTLYIYDPDYPTARITTLDFQFISSSYNVGQQNYIVIGPDVSYNEEDQGLVALNWDGVVIDTSIEITGAPTGILNVPDSSYAITYTITDNSSNTNAVQYIQVSDNSGVSNYSESDTRYVHVNTFAAPGVALYGVPEMTIMTNELPALYNFSFDDGVLGQVVSDDGPVGNLTISYEYHQVLQKDPTLYYPTSTQLLDNIQDISNPGEYFIKYIVRDTHGRDVSFGYSSEFPSTSMKRRILVIEDPNASHSVQFQARDSTIDTYSTIDATSTANSGVDFDIVALGDLSGDVVNTPEFSSILYQEGFDFTDSSAVAVLDVSLSYLNATDTKPALFKFNLPVSSSTNQYEDAKGVLRYKTDVNGWTDISFSTANVTIGNVNTFHHDQTIGKDFYRSNFEQILGSTRVNALFKNRENLHEHITALDVTFNNQIKTILGFISEAGFLTDNDYGAYKDGSQNFQFSTHPLGRFDETDPDNGHEISGEFDPYGYDTSFNSDMSQNYHSLKQSRFSAFNPFRILARTLLAASDAYHEDFDVSTSDGWNNPMTPGSDISDTNPDDFGNQDRRQLFIDDMNTQVATFWDDPVNNTKEYSAFHSDGSLYSVWLENTSNATLAGASQMNGNFFSEFLNGVYVYGVLNNTSTGSSMIPGAATDVSAEDLIDRVVDMSYNFNFVQGDRLHLLLKYVPPTNSVIESNYLNAPIKERTYEVILNMVDD